MAVYYIYAKVTVNVLRIVEAPSQAAAQAFYDRLETEDLYEGDYGEWTLEGIGPDPSPGTGKPDCTVDMDGKVIPPLSQSAQ